MRSCLMAIGFSATAACADLPPGQYTVSLVEQGGTAHALASLTVSEGGYRLQWDESRFEDAFLSMRPFKCFEGPERMMCRVPYPYAIARDISGGDLTDLEYDLLFLWKRSGEYGIDMWNGVYYELTETDGQITGRLHEMNMDILSAPPPEGEMRPVKPADLEPGEPESHWLPGLVIR